MVVVRVDSVLLAACSLPYSLDTKMKVSHVQVAQVVGMPSDAGTKLMRTVEALLQPRWLCRLD